MQWVARARRSITGFPAKMFSTALLLEGLARSCSGKNVISFLTLGLPVPQNILLHLPCPPCTDQEDGCEQLPRKLVGSQGLPVLTTLPYYLHWLLASWGLRPVMDKDRSSQNPLWHPSELGKKDLCLF